MKKIIRLTESDLIRLVRRVINEQSVPGNQATDNVIGKIGGKINLYTDSRNKKMLGHFKIKKVSGNKNSKIPYIFIDLNDANNKEYIIRFNCLSNNIGFKALRGGLNAPDSTVYSTPLEDNLKNGYCKTLTSTSTNSGVAPRMAPSVISTNPTKRDYKNDYKNFKFNLLNDNKNFIGVYNIIDGEVINGEVMIIIESSNDEPNNRRGKYTIKFSCVNKKSGFEVVKIHFSSANGKVNSTVYSDKLEEKLKKDFCMINKSGVQVPKADFASTSTNNSQNYTNNSQNYLS